jgi:hypothetical protein
VRGGPIVRRHRAGNQTKQGEQNRQFFHRIKRTAGFYRSVPAWQGSPRDGLPSGCEIKFFERFASPAKSMRRLGRFLDKAAGANGKAARARRTPRPAGTSAAQCEREASWSAERQFRFGLDIVVVRQLEAFFLLPCPCEPRRLRGNFDDVHEAEI